MGSDDREGGKGRGVGVRGLEEMRRFKRRRLKEERQPGLVVRMCKVVAVGDCRKCKTSLNTE